MEAETLTGILKLSLFCMCWSFFGYGFGYAAASKEYRKAIEKILLELNGVFEKKQ